MFQYPHPCLGSLTAVKPAPFWCHIWPNSWVAKEMDELGRLTECGVQSSAASFACLPASETSGFAWHEEALGSIFKCCHFQHSSWLHGERGDGPGWKPGSPLVGGGGICLGNCKISVSKQCASCCDLQLGSMEGGQVGFQGHTCDSSRLLGQDAWQPGAGASQAAGQEGQFLTGFH